MFSLVTGKKKEFNTIIARSGAGKTALAYLLIKCYCMPTLIIDSCNQFQGERMTFTQFLELSTDAQFLEDFYSNNRTYVIDSNQQECKHVFSSLMKSRRFKKMLIFVDEIDMYLGSDRVHNSHPFYEFINRGRHKEFYLITTSRNTANIPTQLIAQTDNFYFSDLIEKGALKFVDETFKAMNIIGLIQELENYQFLKVLVNAKKVQRFYTKMEWLDFFTSQKK